MSDAGDENLGPILEAPPTPELPGSSGSLLFDNDSLALSATKLAALEGIFHQVARNCGFDEFMREVLLVVIKAVRSEAGTIFEIDQENQCFFFRATVGQVSDRLDRFTIPLGKGIVGHVAESRQPVTVSNLEENALHLKTIGDSLGFHARNLVALPIIIRGRVFGVLELLNRVGEETYTQADLELLGYISEVVSRATEIRLMIGWALADSRKGKAA